MTKRSYNRLTARRRRNDTWRKTLNKFILIRCRLHGVFSCSQDRVRKFCKDCTTKECMLKKRMGVVTRECPECTNKRHTDEVRGTPYWGT